MKSKTPLTTADALRFASAVQNDDTVTFDCRLTVTLGKFYCLINQELHEDQKANRAVDADERPEDFVNRALSQYLEKGPL